MDWKGNQKGILIKRELLDRQHINPMERTISNTARVIHIRIVAKSVSPDRKKKKKNSQCACVSTVSDSRTY